uniref:Ganglioside induced differentiation associated protein 1 n=1 Tax=Homo sapiens TaxID=9606 RepID=A0A6Q8PHN7_HUMAN
MAERQEEQRGSPPLRAEGKADAEVKLILYHWTHSFSSQKVRLVIAEKALKCEEHDVSLPLSEHNEPWFMRLNSTGEVPVLIHGENIICEATQIIDYLEQTFLDERTPRLMPDKESMYYPRVQHYRELLDSLPMDAYTHGCILHPELTVDSMIPAYATTRIRSQIGNTESELKKLAEENPDLQEAYIAKQKRLKSKLLDHDNVKYLKKILDELEKVLDQVETELQRRNEETPEMGSLSPWLECSGMIIVCCSLDLLGSSNPSTSASQVAETTEITNASLLIGVNILLTSFKMEKRTNMMVSLEAQVRK